MASTVCLSYLHLLQTKLKETRWKKRPPHERNAKSTMLRYWCRRKQLLLIMLSIITLMNPPRDRNCWMRPNSDDWFILADSTFKREQWYENFRDTRDTFTIILNDIEHDIAKQDTTMRKAVPMRKKLAMTLYYFASTAEFRTIANLFGVSRAFLCNCTQLHACAVALWHARYGHKTCSRHNERLHTSWNRQRAGFHPYLAYFFQNRTTSERGPKTEK